ncbi:hypothetical protein [Novosphingobium aquae]|uniref:Lipoprotein n=1 Tax=Novosphingobium aquae TaxID=3133435 RepID=A0ABU8S821_9SPHN
MTLALGLLATSASGANATAIGDSDLRCAGWAAMMVGTNQKDKELASSMSLVLAFFIGRWEGTTGKRFEQGLTADYINKNGAEIEGAKDECLPRMMDLGTRMTTWGDVLQGK